MLFVLEVVVIILEIRDCGWRELILLMVCSFRLLYLLFLKLNEECGFIIGIVWVFVVVVLKLFLRVKVNGFFLVVGVWWFFVVMLDLLLFFCMVFLIDDVICDFIFLWKLEFDFLGDKSYFNLFLLKKG